LKKGTELPKTVPVMTSVPCTDYIARWAKKNYGLSKATRCSFWFQGLNLVYHIYDGSKKYALKIYRHWWRTPAQVEYELKELLFLQKAGIPVTTPLPNLKGGYSLSLGLPDGEAVAVLFTFAEGEIRQKPLPALAKKAGELLARLHKAQDQFFFTPPSPPKDAELLVTEQMKLLALHRPSFGKQWPLLESSAARLKRELARLPRKKPLYGLIHGDFHYGNMHYDPSRKTYVLFDLELTALGWRLYDLATFLWDLWDDSPTFSLLEKRQGTKAFLKAYSSVRTLEPAETLALPAMMAARQLHWMGAQADYAPKLSGILVSAGRHHQIMEFLKSWMSGKLEKMLFGGK
jgi:Ser/Thr protein kinase RdoA (MazF antagonist)